jgi:AraC-like DNA-binding protein
MIAFMNAPIAAPANVETHLVEEVDAFASALADGLRGECVQLQSTPLGGRWTVVRLARLVAQFGSADGPVIWRLRAPVDRCARIVPLDWPAGARWNGGRVDGHQVIVCPPGVECVGFDPPRTAFAVLTTGGTGPWARPASAAVTGAAGTVDVIRAPAVLALREALTRVRDAVSPSLAPELAPAQAEVVDGLAACVDRLPSGCGAGPRVETCWTRIVQQAERFFRDHVSEGVSVARLSSVAGVSERSLRSAFHEVYTTSPKRYMLLWQLHQVRHALRIYDDAMTVTEAATCYGFYELGRFARAYRSLFGEVPSQTLSNARHQRQVPPPA